MTLQMPMFETLGFFSYNKEQKQIDELKKWAFKAMRLVNRALLSQVT